MLERCIDTNVERMYCERSIVLSTLRRLEIGFNIFPNLQDSRPRADMTKPPWSSHPMYARNIHTFHFESWVTGQIFVLQNTQRMGISGSTQLIETLFMDCIRLVAVDEFVRISVATRLTMKVLK